MSGTLEISGKIHPKNTNYLDIFTFLSTFLHTFFLSKCLGSIMFLSKLLQITFSRGPSSNFFEMSKNILYGTLSGIVTTRF